MTQVFYAPPVGTVFEDTPYGHALIARYMPWLLANAFNHDIVVAHSGDSLEGIFSDGRYSNYIENRKWLPWTVLKTNESLSYLFTQDTELPMAVPPIGTEINDRNCQEFVLQYPAFDKYINELPDNAHYEYVEKTDFGLARIIAHPPHSVVVPFVEPVEVETTTSETKKSEEPTVTKPIVTTMDKILRPEIGYVIRTPEEVEKFLTFLQLHTDCSKSDTSLDYVTTTGGDWAKAYAFRNKAFLPYTVNGICPDYGDIFITEAELAQAEAEAQQVKREHVSDTNVGDIEERVAKLEAKMKMLEPLIS